MGIRRLGVECGGYVAILVFVDRGVQEVDSVVTDLDRKFYRGVETI